ncbi:MAG: protein translocase subunit SecD [Cellulosilyticaceae bacterium]
MKDRKSTFFIMLVAIAALAYVAIFGIGNLKGANQMRYGIDIRGGVDAVYEPLELNRKPTANEMDAARSVIEARLDSKNILDREVTVDGENGRVLLRFPWKSDEKDFNPEQAITELGQTAKLTFRDPANNVILEGKHVKKSTPQADTTNNKYVVQLSFDEEGAKLFAEATKRLVGQPISIYMDELLISSATVNEPITDGNAVISGTFTPEESKELAEQINAGALPFSMITKNYSTISPTLGSGALDVMVMAGMVAFALICVFMIAKYRLVGLVSCIVLGMQLAAQLLALSIPQFTLTLPGIAGIILSLGMSVDTNVIIGERIGEELRKGNRLEKAILNGYHRAFSAVFDGNATSAIVAIILMIFGSGTMLSFGYTLLTGIILNFAAGIFSSKIMLLSITKFKKMQAPALFSKGREYKTIPFYQKRWIAFGLSITLFVIGIVGCLTKGVQMDIQFKGGAILKYTYQGELDSEKVSQVIEPLFDRPLTVQITSDLGSEEKKLNLTFAGNNGFLPEEQARLNDALNSNFKDSQIKLSESYMVEPYIGQKALINSALAIALSFFLIVIYVWARFRYIGGLSAGMMALVALFHDVCIVFFTFVVLGIPLNDTFVAITLTIIGYSINDTIVIYDRIREELGEKRKEPLATVVNKSITQSLTRSINTSITTFISVLIMYLFAAYYGIHAIEIFALPMMVGVISGCYSTIFIAGQLWVSWKNHKKTPKKTSKKAIAN